MATNQELADEVTTAVLEAGEGVTQQDRAAAFALANKINGFVAKRKVTYQVCVLAMALLICASKNAVEEDEEVVN